MLRLYRQVLAALFFAWISASGAAAQQGWELLGTTLSEPRIEQSIIRVGRTEGRYQAIRLQVDRNDAQILDLRIVYGNGQSESITVRDVFRAGTQSRRIPVAGRERFIKEVVVTYRALGPVQIQVFGEPAVSQRWVELGCKTVGFLIDRDVINLSRQDGTFSSIRLRARGNKIEIFDLRVVYGNGAVDVLPVRSVIPDRGETRPIALKGERRALSRVEMIYRAVPNFKGQALICVDGLRVR